MPNTLEVIKFRDIIRIEKLPRFVPDQPGPTLEVQGEDFTSVENVFLNETEVRTYTIINRNTMWVLVPESEIGDLRTIEVVSGNFTKTAASSKVEFRIGPRSRRISGILKLTQLFTKWLLQSPGSDIFQPERGGGLQDLVGTLVSLERMDQVLSAIIRGIEQTSRQIRTAQSKAVGISLDERLLEATLLDVDQSSERLEARARIHIISMAGDSAVSSLAL